MSRITRALSIGAFLAVLGVTVVGCGASSAPSGGKMTGDKMGATMGDKMSEGKMNNKMGEKMGGKMPGDKMNGDTK
jgi:hypothetical protein